MSRVTAAEKETVLRWDADTGLVTAWTANPNVARQWRRLRWPVEVYGRARDGEPRAWQAEGVPMDRVIFRQMPKKNAAAAGFFTGMLQ